MVVVFILYPIGQVIETTHLHYPVFTHKLNVQQFVCMGLYFISKAVVVGTRQEDISGTFFHNFRILSRLVQIVER